MLYDNVNQTPSAQYYTYPTIALSGQGHSLMGFTSAGPAKYCQAAAANRYRTDAAATFNLPADFTTVTSSYNPGANRWGDFTQTVVAPSDDMTLWTFSQYTPTSNGWGVRAAQFKAPRPATPTLAAIPSCGTATVTINGTSSNHSEFFDPGAGYSKRLRVTVTGPAAVTVSNVIFVNPTKLTANLTFTTGGSYTLIVINPDGQFTKSAPFTVSCSTARKANTTEELKADIYPDPVHDVLSLEFENSGEATIQLMDNNGHVLRQLQSSNNNIKLKKNNNSSYQHASNIVHKN